MNGNDFLDKMELVDEKYVQEAGEPAEKRSRKIFFRWGAMAACCALVLALGYGALSSGNGLVQPATDDSALPQSTAEPAATPVPQPQIELLTYPDRLVLPTAQDAQPQPFEWPELSFDGMGCEGYWMKDFSEFHTGNPWTSQMQFDTLPVYRNTLHSSEGQPAKYADLDLMQEILLAAASRLGLEPDALKLDDNSAEVSCEAEGIRIEVNPALRVGIHFEEPRAYPQEVLAGAVGLELAEKKAAWLAGEYADLLNMEQPVPAIWGGDYLLTGEQLYSIGIYDAAGSDLEKILHYNFYQTRFCNDENGELFLIWLNLPDLTDLMGNYPTITPEQARQELLAGRYVTSVPYEVPSDAEIAHVELVYRGETYDPLYVPYYKFYVDVTDAPEHYTGESMKGLRHYGAYYVPAIDPAYLTGLPLWDGHIN